MITKFDIGEKVVANYAFLAGKTWFEVKGEVESIYITKTWGCEYLLKLWYPEGAKIRGINVSGKEVPCCPSFKESQLRRWMGHQN